MLQLGQRVVDNPVYLSDLGAALTAGKTKVIIHKSRGEVSLLDQPTIECVFLAYLKFI